MLRVNYSRQALQDLDEALGHIYAESRTNAIAYRERYEKKIVLLQSNPEMGTDCNNKNIKLNCRVLVFESHIIVYRLDFENNEILIIRVFHQTKNYQEEF